MTRRELGEGRSLSVYIYESAMKPQSRSEPRFDENTLAWLRNLQWARARDGPFQFGQLNMNADGPPSRVQLIPKISQVSSFAPMSGRVRQPLHLAEVHCSRLQILERELLEDLRLARSPASASDVSLPLRLFLLRQASCSPISPFTFCQKIYSSVGRFPCRLQLFL